MDEDLTPEQQKLKDQVLETAGRALTAGFLRTMSMDPHEAALGAYIKNVTPSVEVLEARIRGFHAAAEERMRASVQLIGVCPLFAHIRLDLMGH